MSITQEDFDLVLGALTLFHEMVTDEEVEQSLALLLEAYEALKSYVED